MAIDLLVVHAISLPPGRFGGHAVDDLFLGRLDPEAHPAFRDLASLRVSAHFLVDREGGLTQYVPILDRAWHSGVSHWQDRDGCNDFSIGVELEGDEQTPFSAVQYLRLGTLIRTLQQGLRNRGMNGLTDDRIVGHQHVAPGRKWDPGPHFDWERLRGMLKEAVPDPQWPLIWEKK